MKLANADRAIVDESKVVEYLLSARHPDGRSKATFFLGFGFRVQHWEGFARALRDHGSTGEVAKGVEVRLRNAVQRGRCHREPRRAQSTNTDGSGS